MLDSVKAYSVQHTGVNYTWLTSTDSISYQPLANSNVANLLNYGTKQTTWFKRVASLNSQCFDTSTAFKIKISNYIPPKIDTIVGPSVCEGDTVILQCMNPYSKFWQVNGSFTFDTGTIIRITTPGEYSVFVTNNAGCAGFSDTVTVSINALPQPQIHAWYDTLKSHVPWAQYRWYKNDTLVIGADSSYMLALVTGMYTLEAIDSNGCTGTAKLFYTPSSVNDLLPSEAMQIFPNPATDQFTILNNSAVPIDVSIYDMQGRMWKELKIDKGVKQFHIRTGGLPPGVYQVTAIVDGDMLHHKLVIR